MVTGDARGSLIKWKWLPLMLWFSFCRSTSLQPAVQRKQGCVYPEMTYIILGHKPHYSEHDSNNHPWAGLFLRYLPWTIKGMRICLFQKIDIWIFCQLNFTWFQIFDNWRWLCNCEKYRWAFRTLRLYHFNGFKLKESFGCNSSSSANVIRCDLRVAELNGLSWLPWPLSRFKKNSHYSFYCKK